jgi:hypothetical protein
MTQNRKSRLLLAGIFVLVTIAVFIFWLGSLDTTPSSDSNLAVATAQTPNDPQSIDLIEVVAVADVETNEMPLDDRSAFVEQLLEKGLPLKPNVRRVEQQSIEDKSAEQLIEEFGHLWTSSAGPPNISRNETSIVWLNNSLLANLRVKKLILEGRKNPEWVGSLLSQDLMRRTRQWGDTVEAYEKAYREKGSLGLAVSNDGEEMGSSAFKKYLQDKYAIPAEMFILMNINYEKALEAFAEYADWRYSVPKKIVMTPEGPRTHWTLQRRGPYGSKPIRDRLNNDMLLYATATLLQNNTDPKYQKVRERLGEILKDRPICTQEITDTPEALWPEGHPLLVATEMNTPSEDKMNILVPNLDLIENNQLWKRKISALGSLMIEVHKKTDSTSIK